MPNQTIVSHLYLSVDGTPVGEEVLRQILEVTVDQHVHLPGMFTLRLADPDLVLLDRGLFDLTKVVEIAGHDQKQQRLILMVGEVTALEPTFGEGMIAELVVRGYDRLHRLYREVKSKTYLNIKDSDLATQIAKAAGLTAEVETTRTVYDHLYQHNQSDLNFLMERAWRIGYECFVTDKQLFFRKPTTSGAPITLTWGDELVTFQPRLTLAEQVTEVVVRGWDIRKKSPIVGRAAQGQLYPQFADDQAQDGGALAPQLGSSKLVLVDQPVVSQAEADILAAARLDELSGSFIEAEGMAFRRPEISAGRLVKLVGLGKRFSATYLVTSLTHTYTNSGFLTNFRISGTRTGLLLDQLQAHNRVTRQAGPAAAIVTNTDDPNGWGRVKVKYPWLSEQEESDWMRVASAGAGPGAGFCTTPAVDDEVLVAFVHGDFNRPVLLGNLWNGQDAIPAPTANAPSGEKPLVRTWSSRTGHQITIYDNAENKIEVKTKAGHCLILSDADRKITLITQGQLEITLDDSGKEIMVKSTGKVTLQAGNELAIEATGNMSLSAGGNFDLQARGNVQIQATGRASVGAAAMVALQAPQISLG